jgi:hypothetical protein
MVTAVVIIILSLAMFVYWFRYSCLLILESDWNEDKANVVALQNGLSFGSIKEKLASAESAEDMESVRDLLDRDLSAVLSLLASRADSKDAGISLECRMLMLDYQFMKVWFAVTRPIAGPAAQLALREMALVVGYMAGECEEKLVTVSE